MTDPSDTTGSFDPPVSPLLGLGVAVVAVSTSAVLVRWSEAPSLVKAFYRVGFTVTVLSPLVLTRARGAFGRLGRRDAVLAVASGCALALHFAAWFESLTFTSVAASVTLVQAQPLFVVLGARALLDERITCGTVVGVGVAFVGIGVMTVGDVALSGVASGATVYGNGLALVGAVAAAAYVLLGRSVRQRLPLLPYVFVVYVACASVLLGVVVASGHPLVGYPPREWVLFLAMAVGPGLLGHTVINWTLAHLESSVVSVSLLGEPVGSTLLAVFLLSEIPSVAAVVGGLVVLSGIYVTTRTSGV